MGSSIGFNLYKISLSGVSLLYFGAMHMQVAVRRIAARTYTAVRSPSTGLGCTIPVAPNGISTAVPRDPGSNRLGVLSDSSLCFCIGVGDTSTTWTMYPGTKHR